MPPLLAGCTFLATSVLLAWGCSRAAADLSGYFLDEQEKGAVSIRGGYMMFISWTIASIPSTTGARPRREQSKIIAVPPCSKSCWSFFFTLDREVALSLRPAVGRFLYFSYFRPGRILGVWVAVAVLALLFAAALSLFSSETSSCQETGDMSANKGST